MINKNSYIDECNKMITQWKINQTLKKTGTYFKFCFPLFLSFLLNSTLHSLTCSFCANSSFPSLLHLNEESHSMYLKSEFYVHMTLPVKSIE